MSLKEKINKAKEIIIKTSQRWKEGKVAVAWTGGKDSTTTLHLVKEAFQGKIPFWVMFNDSTIEFPEVYQFVKKLSKEWNLNLIWQKHLKKDLDTYHQIINRVEKTDSSRKKDLVEQAMEVMRLAKINAANYTIKKYKIKAFISGIRWDEHQARSKEKYFSPRSTHFRVHPILHFTLDDVWQYIKEYKVPYVSLYDQGYKSLGEAPFTKPVKDPNAPERAGREATKEKTMERLRQLGYW